MVTTKHVGFKTTVMIINERIIYLKTIWESCNSTKVKKKVFMIMQNTKNTSEYS